jgi:hypothetical protein
MVSLHSDYRRAANALNVLQQTNTHAWPVLASTQSPWISKKRRHVRRHVPLLQLSTASVTPHTSDHPETIKTEEVLTEFNQKGNGNRREKGMHPQTPLLLHSRLFGEILEHVSGQATQVSTWRLQPHNVIPANSAVFRSILENDLVALRHLLYSRQASVYDSTNTGWTTLHVCVLFQTSIRHLTRYIGCSVLCSSFHCNIPDTGRCQDKRIKRNHSRVRTWSVHYLKVRN